MTARSMNDEPLWTPAVDAMSVTAYFVAGHGWNLTVAHRRSGRSWSEGAPADRYSHLTTDETVAIEACLASLFGARQEREPI